MDKADKDRSPFQFICKDEIFNEDGLVIIQWNLTSECELLKLNGSFIDEHRLFKPQILVNGTYSGFFYFSTREISLKMAIA